jgi:cytochrome c
MENSIPFSTALLLVALFLCGCVGGKKDYSYPVSTGGSAKLGRQWIEKYQCGKCHSIPGIRHADGVFGPPLVAMGSRTMIAGNFPNTPENMVHWIQAPTSMKPKTDMPDLGISEQQSRDVAQYIESLQ